MSNDAQTAASPLPAALPAVDLAPLWNQFSGEWGYGPNTGVPGGWNSGNAIVGYPTPDPESDTIYIRKIGWTRDELPGLAGFLMAVYAASDPAARVCDCGTEDATHEAFCAVAS